MLKVLVPAALVAMLAGGAAMAAPGSSATTTPLKSVSASDVVEAQYRPGRRYKRAPQNWRRYDRRPGDWRTRGCVIVGPVWFCP